MTSAARNQQAVMLMIFATVAVLDRRTLLDRNVDVLFGSIVSEERDECLELLDSRGASGECRARRVNMQHGGRSMQRSRKDRQAESEELLAQALRICCQNDEMLGQRVAGILRLPIPKSTMSEGTAESLDDALRILAYVRAEHQLQGPICRDQIDACIQEIVAGLAATLVRVSLPRISS